MAAAAPDDILDALRRLGVIATNETPRCTALAGGVSSDIWRVDRTGGPVCVKRALPRLKVAADWQAPVERNSYEVRWFETVAAIEPAAVPRLLAHDPEAGLFVMEYLDPDLHPVWKEELRAGRVDLVTAAIVGRRLARIHAGTADRPDLARRFDTGVLFHSLRLEPYLEAAAWVHVDRAEALMALVRETAATRRVLVHGDVSPKNILIGPAGPVFLDAECAWYGDPAFDLAFCLNHLLLKCLWTPRVRKSFLLAFRAVADSYLRGVTWEPGAAVEARAAHLLPGLMLARVDGKSPVEYITEEPDLRRVRLTARRLLAAPVETLADVASAWQQDLTA